MSESAVRFAILGFGHHASKRLAPAFAQSQLATLTGAWRRDQSALERNCSEQKIANAFPSREALCSSPDVDVVFITSPDAMHKKTLCSRFRMARRSCARSLWR